MSLSFSGSRGLNFDRIQVLCAFAHTKFDRIDFKKPAEITFYIQVISASWFRVSAYSLDSEWLGAHLVFVAIPTDIAQCLINVDPSLHSLATCSSHIMTDCFIITKMYRVFSDFCLQPPLKSDSWRWHAWSPPTVSPPLCVSISAVIIVWTEAV